MSLMVPPDDLVERFKRDLGALADVRGCALGVAVSGGPDSLALLLLAAAAMPGRVKAATVDHKLRAESGSEAAFVAAVCERLGVAHATLGVDWPDPAGGNLQARARDGRYHELAGWALDNDIASIATAHHLDDQAETVLMRLGRGSGVGGLAGTRRVTLLAAHDSRDASVHLVRPLLGWRRSELAGIVAAAELEPVDDPTNRDERFDRTRVRALLAGHPALSPARLADSAAHLAEAEQALDWSSRRLYAERAIEHDDGSVTLEVADVPREYQRRLLLHAFAWFNGCTEPPGPKLNRLLDLLRAGRKGTLAGVIARGGPVWKLDWAPPRRDTAADTGADPR